MCVCMCVHVCMLVSVRVCNLFIKSKSIISTIKNVQSIFQVYYDFKISYWKHKYTINLPTIT